MGFHTVRQVALGAGLGISFAVTWFSLMKHLRRNGVTKNLLDCELSEMLHVKDCFVLDVEARLENERRMWKKSDKTL